MGINGHLFIHVRHQYQKEKQTQHSPLKNATDNGSNSTDTTLDSYELSTISEKVEKPNAQFTGNSEVLQLVEKNAMWNSK